MDHLDYIDAIANRQNGGPNFERNTWILMFAALGIGVYIGVTIIKRNEPGS